MTTVEPVEARRALADAGVTTVGVVGFGTMGCGIAQVCAVAGLDVRIVEPDAGVVDRGRAAIDRSIDRLVRRGTVDADAAAGAVDRIITGLDLGDLRDADVVIEAIPERLDAKLALFGALEGAVGPDTILATNTSALSVTRIAAATTSPQRVCGLHWFNPVPMLPLVEVVRAERTSDATIDRAHALVTGVGHHPITCADTPGFVVNRILLPILADVIALYEAGLASATDIDDGCRLGLGWPLGPLALCDLIGLDVALDAATALHASTSLPHHAPPPGLVRMVHAGKLGRKSGEGFYSYGSE